MGPSLSHSCIQRRKRGDTITRQHPRYPQSTHNHPVQKLRLTRVLCTCYDTCMGTHTHVHTQRSMSISQTHSYVHTLTHTLIPTLSHIHFHTHSHIHTFTHTHSYALTCTHILMLSNMPISLLPQSHQHTHVYFCTHLNSHTLSHNTPRKGGKSQTYCCSNPTAPTQGTGFFPSPSGLPQETGTSWAPGPLGHLQRIGRSPCGAFHASIQARGLSQQPQ